MHAYILENENEVARLEKQNALKHYNVSEELKDLNVSNSMSILDAGCGTGVITRHLLANFSPERLTAIDFSETRLAQAKKIIAQSHSVEKIDFKRVDMMNETMQERQFDLIISRFVMHHLTDPQVAISMLSRTLRSGGCLCIIDSDGIMFNLQTKDKWLQKTLETIKAKLSVDMFVGRKLKLFMDLAKLTSLDSKIIPMHFTGEELMHEKIQYQERFFAMKSQLEAMLGGDADKFVSHYLAAFDEPTTELFYNKFVTQGHSK